MPVLGPSGIFQFRRRVPVELRSVLGHEYKRSLETRDPAVAEVRQAEELLRCKAAFAQARAQLQGAEVLTARDIELLASRWHRAEVARMEASGDFASRLADGGTIIVDVPDRYETHVPMVSLAEAMQDDPDLDISVSVETIVKTALKQDGIPLPSPHTETYARLMAAFSSHLLRLSELALKRHHGDWLSKPQALANEALSFQPSPKAGKPEGKRLLAVFEGYAQDKLLNDGKVRGVERTIASFRATIEQFAELFGDLPVREITRDLIRQYRGLMARLPAKGEGIRKLGVRQLIAKADAENLPRIQEVTMRNKLRTMSAVMGYALRMGEVNENPVIAGGFARAAARAAANRGAANRHRKHYVLEELQAIFTSPIFSDASWTAPRANFGEAWRWMPLLMYYTGARREELAQLHAKDVLTSNDEIGRAHV